MWLPGIYLILFGCTTATTKTDLIKVDQKELNNNTDKLLDYDLTVLLNNAFPGKNSEGFSSRPALLTNSVPDQIQNDSDPSQQEVANIESLQTPIDCVCIPFYQCWANKTINEYGENIIDIRLRDGPCEDYLLFCCHPGNTTDTSIAVTQTPPIKPFSDSCGRRNIYGVSSLRITGAVNNEAQFGEFPWMIAVLAKVTINNTQVNVYQCGGSLINPQVVLTAAHCVKGKGDLRVRAGEWDTQRKTEPLPTQNRLVKDVVIHEEYYRGALFNDIALLFLEFPVELAPNVAPICLPQQGESMEQRNCVACGWGKDVYGKEGKYQVILKKVDLPIVPRDNCLAALRKTILGKNFKLHSSFLCAGGIPNRDTCSGDGGSPLVCPSKDSPEIYVQAGIVSWGIGCNTEVPGAYVDVAKFRNWIDDKLNLHNMTL